MDGGGVSIHGVCELIVCGDEERRGNGGWMGVFIDLERRWIGRQRRGIRRVGQWIVCW